MKEALLDQVVVEMQTLQDLEQFIKLIPDEALAVAYEVNMSVTRRTGWIQTELRHGAYTDFAGHFDNNWDMQDAWWTAEDGDLLRLFYYRKTGFVSDVHILVSMDAERTAS